VPAANGDQQPVGWGRIESHELRIRELPKILVLFVFRGLPVEKRTWRGQREDRRASGLPAGQSKWIRNRFPGNFK
jgi:hypothetical protein